MWHRVEVVLTDVSEERIASIFRVEGQIRKSAREASVRDVKSRLVCKMRTANPRRANFSNINKVFLHLWPSTNPKLAKCQMMKLRSNLKAKPCDPLGFETELRNLTERSKCCRI
jgi:hypothetical protein